MRATCTMPGGLAIIFCHNIIVITFMCKTKMLFHRQNTAFPKFLSKHSSSGLPNHLPLTMVKETRLSSFTGGSVWLVSGEHADFSHQPANNRCLAYTSLLNVSCSWAV